MANYVSNFKGNEIDAALAAVPNKVDKDVLDTRLGTTGNLGTAAQRPVMTSLTDTTTTNALMPRGAFGVGNTAGVLMTDANALGATGFYQGGATWIGSPTPGTDGSNQGTLIHIQWGSGNAYAVQYFFPVNLAFTPRVRRKDDNVWSAWRLDYNQANIIGTVSQSGGVPTGAIIESGSNANGIYVRYADGTQICYTNRETSVPINNAIGNLFWTGSNLWTYPATFSALPTVTVSEAGGVGVCWGGLGTGGTNSANTTFALFRAEAVGTRPTASLTAIGRWY